jgi:hypothetical protein
LPAAGRHHSKTKFLVILTNHIPPRHLGVARCRKYIASLIYAILIPGAGCRQSYMPPAQKTNLNILVIDGIINTGTGAASSFTLSRTQKIGDSLGAYAPELQAQITIVGSAGDTWSLQEQGDGVYTSSLLSLNPTEKYQLIIHAADGSRYSSDSVTPTTSPPIDSLSWDQQADAGNVTINANTHDPANNSHYYRWIFTETWEYQAELTGELYVSNGLLYYVDSTTQITSCWESDQSTNILLANTTGLNQDLVSQAPLTSIPPGDRKISTRYSMLASQYVLTASAYQYWLTLQKNTQNLGSLFDPQPSQLTGNYHCLSNPGQPVIGFLSAGRITTQRLFIQRSQVNNWDTTAPNCPIDSIPQNPTNYQIYTDNNPNVDPYYLTTTGYIVLSSKACLDCRLQGGTTKKPDFW